MGELNTISVKNETRREQLKRERQAEERRKKALREKRRKMQLIRYYCFSAIIIMVLSVAIVLLLNAVFNGSDDLPDNHKGDAQGYEQSEQVAFDPSFYTFSDEMYRFDNTVEILEKLEALKYSKAELSDKIDFIYNHQKAYPENLIKLIVKSPEAIDFAVEYPFKRGQNNSLVVDISGDYTKGEIPLLLQWDDRWGYVSYGDDIIALDGCGPTCLSMVAVGLTGNVKWTPVRIARMSELNGYYVEGQGTAWSLMYEGCEFMGLQAKEIGLAEEEMAAQLKKGHPIIASMAPGDFTDGGHFIVIVGYEDGKFIVNDPNSKKNSSTGWTYERIKGQIKNMWAYSLAE